MTKSPCAPNLRALDLSFSPTVTRQGLAALLRACPKLEELDVSGCTGVLGDELMMEVSRPAQGINTLVWQHRKRAKQTIYKPILKMSEPCNCFLMLIGASYLLPGSQIGHSCPNLASLYIEMDRVTAAAAAVASSSEAGPEEAGPPRALVTCQALLEMTSRCPQLQVGATRAP